MKRVFFPKLDGIALATTPSTGCQVLDSWITPATINVESSLREGKINTRRLLDEGWKNDEPSHT